MPLHEIELTRVIGMIKFWNMKKIGKSLETRPFFS